MSSSHDDGIQTRAIHASVPLDSTGAVTPPIWQTSTFRAGPEAFARLAPTVKLEAIAVRT
jgi:cystathionine beta-lyase/cystathionine gamma-synthase